MPTVTANLVLNVVSDQAVNVAWNAVYLMSLLVPNLMN